MVLLIHIVAGGLGLVSGTVALCAAKGLRLHRKSGMLFVYAMLTMSISGAGIAAWTGVGTSVTGGLLTAYLVITALTTVRPPTGGSRRLDLGAMSVGLAVGLANVAMGFDSLAKGERMRDGAPVAMLFVFGSVALLASVADVRVLRLGGLRGGRRLARHLWRMCFALFIASASFFLGQADKIPEPLRITPVLIALALAPLAIMVYWLWRIRVRPVHRANQVVSSLEPI